MSPENHILFDRWVVVPLAALRAIPRADGAFAALSMTFGLYERFLASKIHQRGHSPNDEKRWAEASADFDGKVSAPDFKKFWEMYRVGMQHYFHPKHFTKGSDGMKWGWDISEHESYHAYPEIVQNAPGLFIITLNPWAFADHVVKRWYEFPELIDELSATALGAVRLPEQPRPWPVTSLPGAPMSTYTERPDTQNHGSTGKWPG